jgi:hypothetical protein
VYFFETIKKSLEGSRVPRNPFGDNVAGMAKFLLKQFLGESLYHGRILATERR